MLNILHMQYKIYVKCGTFIILNYLIMLELNYLFNICVFYTLRNADIVLICVYMNDIYIQCFIVVHNCCLLYYFTSLC